MHRPSIQRQRCRWLEAAMSRSKVTVSLTNDRMHKVSHVAERTNLSTREIRRQIAEGNLIVHRFGRAIRISEADLQRFIAARRQSRRKIDVRG
jgi:excisionase family DNA binding protein